MKDKLKYKVGEHVRVKYGCLWLFGIVTHVNHGMGVYEVSYGSRREWNGFMDGGMLPYWNMMYENELKSM